MKREIVCIPCGERIQKAIMPSEPGEYSKFVYGKTKLHSQCDGCGVKLPKGSNAAGLSIWTDRIPYYEWESEYIEDGGEL